MGLLSAILALFDDPPAKTRPSPSRPSKPTGPRWTRHLWEERGWTRHGEGLRGYYRTRRGSFRGRIERINGTAEYYVTSPPKALLSGPHGLCFRERRGGEFFIHFNTQPEHVDQGILYIERLLREALP